MIRKAWHLSLQFLSLAIVSLLFAGSIAVAHASVKPSSAHVMDMGSHEVSKTSSCSAYCLSASFTRDEDDTRAEDDEDEDDDIQRTPFYSLVSPPLEKLKLHNPLKDGERKSPTKYPLYIQYSILRN